jgi:hypothetical protein
MAYDLTPAKENKYKYILINPGGRGDKVTSDFNGGA